MYISLVYILTLLHPHIHLFTLHFRHAGYTYCGECGGYAYRQINPALVWVQWREGGVDYSTLDSCLLLSFRKRIYYDYSTHLLSSSYFSLLGNGFSYWDHLIMYVCVDVPFPLPRNVKHRYTIWKLIVKVWYFYIYINYTLLLNCCSHFCSEFTIKSHRSLFMDGSKDRWGWA